MRLKKKVVQGVEYQLISVLANFLYLAGLTALIPLLPLALSPAHFINAKYAFGIAVVLIVLSFFAIFFVTKSKKKAFFSLGNMTLVPGLLAVIFAYVGERRMIFFLSDLRDISPLVQGWVNTYVPKTWMLAGIYIIAGVMLVWISEQVD